MPDKASKKKTEIPQPRPDIVLPDDNGSAGLGSHTDPHSAACNETYQQAFQGRCTTQEEP